MYNHLVNNIITIILAHAERQAINTTIQGSAADITKIAMIKLDKNVNQSSLKLHVQLVMHLHDELIFEVFYNFWNYCLNLFIVKKNKVVEPVLFAQVSNSILEEACSTIVKIMESAVNLSVPLPVKLRKGSSWGDLK